MRYKIQIKDFKLNFKSKPNWLKFFHDFNTITISIKKRLLGDQEIQSESA